MKWHRLQCDPTRACFIALGLIVILSIEVRAETVGNTPPKTRFDDLIASTGATNVEAFESVANALSKDQQLLVYELLGVLKNPNSPNSARSYAAYYLGEVRAPRSANGSHTVDGLAAVITLNYEAYQEQIIHMRLMTKYPAFWALVEIGFPSFPAVIRNLEESDDARVRDLSLKVLYRVEGDKEIARVRLQHAVDAQKDAKKQARLQSALKSLSEMAADPMP